jgi:uncharacterized protein YndB with AHSA1/START domain
MKGPGAPKVTTPTDREVVITRVFDAPRSMVFDSWTKPELLQRWLLGPEGWSMPVCEVDLRVGGSYRFVWRKAGQKDLAMGGVYREVVRPERIVSTEQFDQDWTGGETVSTLVFVEKAGKTTVTNTVRYSSREARDGALKTGMEQGIAASYDRLEQLLATSLC